MDDERFFEQLDMLGRDANATDDLNHHDGAAYSAYGHYSQPCADQYALPAQHDTAQDEFVQEAVAFDSFDERLLNQPDIDSRHAQAALGRARLSLPTSRDDLPYPRSQSYLPSQPLSHLMPRSGVSRHHIDPGPPTPMRSPLHRHTSPTYHLSQFHAAPESQAQEPNFAHEPPSMHYERSPRHEPRSDEQEMPSDPWRSLTISAPKAGPAKSQATRGGPPSVQGIGLVSTRDIPDRFRSIFSFPLFNAVQSRCFSVVFQSNDNFVVSAPTGSGKTAILELAICRLMNGGSDGSFKVVYQAPTKSLCSERQRDWQTKFGPLGLQCAELTGDTDQAQLRNVQHASIIVTTPEKWDSVTRKWKDHQRLMQTVKLFLIDEVHILKEDRGATLEAVVSRMKSVGSNVRFIALSATVPNSNDIASWLGKDSVTEHFPAPREKFGEEFRPVRLQKHVCGYHSQSNDFGFEHTLNSKLTEVIAKWSQRKPIMVFCITRKACTDTAKLLANWWSTKGPQNRYWSPPQANTIIADQKLKETIAAGVAFHHAGLTLEDRTAVEQGYLSGDISVICCTSTLAVGVNLPCHMVIIKNTVTYTGTGMKEYSDLEITQMLGRAGRPQFDDSAVAVIMTRIQQVKVYEQMMSGQEILESCLHKHLTEHLNSEIGLGTVTDLASAKKWLKGTFLYVRLKENPQHYHLNEDQPGRDIDERLENICREAIASLKEHDLLRETTKLQSTEFGNSMARYYVQFDTMKNLLALPEKAKVSEILSGIAQAAEFKDLRFRQGEKQVYKELNNHGSIRFPIPVNIGSAAHKVSLVVQSTLAGIELPTDDSKHHFEYMACKKTIFQHANRLIRCIIDCQLYIEDGTSARNALMLACSLGSTAWDDSPLQMTQLNDLGTVRVRKLIAGGIKTIEDIENADPRRIEAILSRNTPYGYQLQEQAKAFPRLRISMSTTGKPVVKKDQCVSVQVKAEIGFLNDRVPEKFGRKSVYVCMLAEISDGHLIHFARISAKKLNKGQEVLFTADLKSPDQTIRGSVMCDDFAGTQRSATMKPEVPGFMFPTPKALEEAKKSQIGAVNAPNVTKWRTSANGKRDRNVGDVDEFEDATLDDATLAAAEDGVFHNIDDYDDDGNISKSTQKPATTKNIIPGTEVRPPDELPNGRYACNHKCDKTKCKHTCCRDGLEKPPKPPKRKESKKEDPAPDPKQTKLDLMSMKTIKPSVVDPAFVIPTPSSAMMHNKSRSKQARDLDQLHNSVQSSVSNVPLIKDKASTKAKATASSATQSRVSSAAHHQQDANSDYGGDLDDNDFLVDIKPVPTQPASSQPTTRMGSPFQDLDVGVNDDDLFDDLWMLKSTADTNQPLIASAAKARSKNDTTDGTQNVSLQQPKPQDVERPVLISDDADSKYSTDPVAGPALSVLLKRDREDQAAQMLSPPLKKRKDSEAGDFSDDMLLDDVDATVRVGTNMQQGSVQDDEAPDAVVGISEQAQAQGQEESMEMSLQEWFENEFGTELFTFKG